MPLGCDSVENAVTEVPPMQCWVVMPISLTYASAENWVSVATPAFQPNLPTRVPFRLCDGSLGLGSTIDTWLAMPRMLDGCAEARLSKNESGIASTRPSPNSGVVRRPTLWIVASGGSCSSGTEQDWPLRPVKLPTVNSWRSEPPRAGNGPLPSLASGSKSWTPKKLKVVPNRRFAYAWKGGNEANVGYGSRLETVVTWTLSKVENGTRVHLVHSGFVLRDNDTAFKSMGEGWKKVVRNIGAIVGDSGS